MTEHERIERGKVIIGLECLAQMKEPIANPCRECGYSDRPNYAFCVKDIASDAISLLKEQENLKQKMWDSLYAKEDNLEKKFIGTEEHDDWFTVYRPWLQRGFEIAIKVIAEQDGM